MSEITYTHKELARMLGVSETTIKSYRRKFPDCIPVANSGKPIRFTEQAGEICLYIRELFSRGMSVPEVGNRLSERFNWTPPVEEVPVADVATAAASVSTPVELPEDYTTALSNLAKSMVELSMQQRTILKKMQSIDERLDQLGAGSGLAGEAQSSKETLPEAFSLWLNQAEGILHRMEAAAHDSRGSETPHKKVVRVRNSFGEETEYRMETEDELSDDAQSLPHQSDEADARTFVFESEEPKEEVNNGKDIESTGESVANSGQEQQGFTPHIVKFPTQQKVQPIYQDPPKQLLSLPLVIKTEDDEFLGVAGRSRGRFNISDLKAVLMDNFFGSKRYHSHWEKTPNGWLLVLAQKDADKEEQHNLAMLVNQTTTPRGNNVALIQHLTINGHDEKTLEVPNFIKEIFERD